MSLLTALYNGRSGLDAAQQGISATSHNVSNALTDGYHIRNVQQSVSTPIQQSGIWIGTGVDVTAIARSADNLLASRQVAQTGVTSTADTLAKDLSVVETWFDESASQGPRLSLTALFDALNQASADPGDSGLRSDVLQTAQTLAGSIRGTAEAIEQAAELYDNRLGFVIDSVNEQFKAIAQLNEQIIQAGGGLKAGDLADQRDAILTQVAQDTGVTAHFEADGTATVFMGGHAVVSGGEAREMIYENPPGGSPAVYVSADDGRLPVTSSLGGTMGGHLQAHATVSGYGQDLDEFAQQFADAMNTQHSAGFDRTGAAGGNLFDYDPADAANSFELSATLVGNPDGLAFAGDPSALAGDGVNLAALADVENTQISGTQTAGDALSSLTSRVGNDIANAASTANREANVLGDLNELSQGLHGVDLDEQAANLLTYQTAYQAAAKVVQVADSLLGNLMEII